MVGVLLPVLMFLIILFTVRVRAAIDLTHRLWLPTVLKSAHHSQTSNLDNPDFELGATGWTFYSTQGGGDIVKTAPVPRGYFSARLGSSWEMERRAYIAQQVVIPQGKPWLTFWHYIDSQEDYCPQYTLYDFVRVEVNGAEQLSFPLCDDGVTVNRVWLKRAVYLGNYQGMSVYLKIYFQSDITLPSDYYVDDFAFE